MGLTAMVVPLVHPICITTPRQAFLLLPAAVAAEVVAPTEVMETPFTSQKAAMEVTLTEVLAERRGPLLDRATPERQAQVVVGVVALKLFWMETAQRPPAARERSGLVPVRAAEVRRRLDTLIQTETARSTVEVEPVLRILVVVVALAHRA